MKIEEENWLRRYLLGVLSTAETQMLEEKYFAEPDFFEQIWAVENELVDAYVRNQLSPAERNLFEQNYLASPRHRERVMIAQNLLQTADVRSVETAPEQVVPLSWGTIMKKLFRGPQLAWGGVLGLFLLLLGGWWFWHRTKPEVAQIVQASPTPSVPITPNVKLPESTVIPTETVKTPTPMRATAPPILAFTLTGAVVRDGGKIQRLHIPLATKQVQLIINLTGADYPQYQIQLRDTAGKELLTQTKITPVVNKKLVTVSIPSKQLPEGDYFLALSGVSQTNEAEELITYFFRVTRK